MRPFVIKFVVILGMAALLGTYLYLNNWKWYWLKTEYSDILNGRPALKLRFLVRGHELGVCNVPITDSFDAKGLRELAFCPISDEQFSALKNKAEHVRILVNEEDVPSGLQIEDSYLILNLPAKKIYIVRVTDFDTIATAIANERMHQHDVLACEGKELCRTIRITGVTGWGALEGPYSMADLSKKRAGLPRGRWGYGPETVLTIQSLKRQKAMVVVYLDQFVPEHQIAFKGNVLAVSSLRPEGEAFDYLGGRLKPKIYRLEIDLQQRENKLSIHYSHWNKPSRNEPRPLAAYLTGFEFKELR